MKFHNLSIAAVAVMAILSGCSGSTGKISGEINFDNSPLLGGTLYHDYSPLAEVVSTNILGTISIHSADYTPFSLREAVIKLEAQENLADVEEMELYYGKKQIGSISVSESSDKAVISVPAGKLLTDSIPEITLCMKMKKELSLTNRIKVTGIKMVTDRGNISFDCSNNPLLRTGIALRYRFQNGVDNCRIPGLVTTTKGTLLAMYDARRDADRDLQGDIDIAYNRSTDGGRTWSELLVAIDMGEYGGLPQKYNGVSDGSMLVDTKTGDIYVTGLWMYGVRDPKNGKFVRNLTQDSTIWNHQWKSFGSQPGYDIKQSCQFMIAKSTDDGLTWSEPVNITRQVKPESYWLMAPAPGAGIVLEDGTLLFPAEGRDETGLQFSTVVYSKDGGQSWIAGKPAYTNTNECMAAQLSDGTIMLNARERSNRNKKEGNGRKIATTADLGETWTIHPTNQSALIESACQGSLLKHIYTDKKGEKHQLLLFFNPSSISRRDNFTLKCSLDDGMTWPENMWIQMDARNGNGYSCMTSVDNETVGILYEGSGANMVFQTIKVSEILSLAQ